MLSTSKLIKIARTNKDLSQDEVAEKLGVSKNYISLIENGKKEPSLKFLKDLAKILDIPALLLMWEKMDLPAGKSEAEKNIVGELEKMISKSQRMFAEKTFGLSK